MNKTRLLYLILFTLGLVLSVSGQEYSNPEKARNIQLVVFGDNWSDDGNVCKATNDRVWNEYINNMNQNDIGINLNYVVHNNAVCGAKSTDLLTEINLFLEEPDIAATDTVVYFIWIGVNDYIGLAEQLQSERLNTKDSVSFLVEAASKVLQLQNDVPARIFAAIDRLLTKGPGKKKYVLIGTLPSFSMFPAGSPLKAFLGLNLSKDLFSGNSLDMLSVMHNMQISEKVHTYDVKQNVRLINFYYLFKQIAKNPKNYGIASLEFECDTPDKCDSELFYDTINFKHTGHYLIANYVNKRIITLLYGSEDLDDVHNKVGLNDFITEASEAIHRGIEFLDNNIKCEKNSFNTDTSKAEKDVPKKNDAKEKTREKIKKFFKGVGDSVKSVPGKIKKGAGKVVKKIKRLFH